MTMKSNLLLRALTRFRVASAASVIAAFALTVFLVPGQALAGRLTLAWDSDGAAGLAGFKVHYGTESGNYAAIADAGYRTNITIPGLTPGMTYYFAAKAYDGAGNESPFSNEVAGTAVDVTATDILWRNTATGELYAWYMNGATYTSGARIDTVEPVWKVEGIGDFNGDGQRDILWRNVTTGEVYLWYMNGPRRTAGQYVATVELTWDIVGAGDFNGDGKPEILWRNGTTGEVYLWYMDGANLASGAQVTVNDPNWLIAGVGDFNGDGKADILWRHRVTGDLDMWLMDGTSRISGVDVALVEQNWSVGGVGDLNGDGKADIIWRDSSTGQNLVWYMDGGRYTQIVPLTTVVESSWQVAGTIVE